MGAVRSKICGITRPEDAVIAAQAGADAIGLVFYARSPRAVNVQQARDIIRALPTFVTVVGLFVNASACEINETLDAVPLDLLQFHGDESPEQCSGYHRPYIKALRVRPGDNLEAACERYNSASGLLLDAFVEGVPGGTGLAFDWDLVPAALPKPIILAGGLTPENVSEAIERVRPFGVDVSGGVELRKGVKDAHRVQAFVKAVRSWR